MISARIKEAAIRASLMDSNRSDLISTYYAIDPFELVKGQESERKRHAHFCT